MTKCYVCPIDLIFLQPQTHPGTLASSRHHQTPSRHPQIPSRHLQILVFLQVRGHCKKSQYLSIITKYYVCQRYLILKQPQTHLDTNIIQTDTIRHHPGTPRLGVSCIEGTEKDTIWVSWTSWSFPIGFDIDKQKTWTSSRHHPDISKIHPLDGIQTPQS